MSSTHTLAYAQNTKEKGGGGNRKISHGNLFTFWDQEKR